MMGTKKPCISLIGNELLLLVITVQTKRYKQGSPPLPDLFCLALTWSGRLANSTLSCMYSQLLLKWEGLVTLPSCSPAVLIGWRVAEATHCRQGICTSVHTVSSSACGFPGNPVHSLMLPACTYIHVNDK